MRTAKPRNLPWLSAVLLGALLLRIGYALSLEPSIRWYDGLEYQRLARCLVDNHAYLNAGGTPTAYWPPGYPAFLAIAGSGVTVVRMVQAFVGTLIVLLGYGIARRFHGERTSALAAVILAAYPLHVYSGGIYSSVAQQTLLLAGVYWLVVRAAIRRAAPSAAAAGALAGGAVLTTATMLPAMIVTPLWLAWETRGRQGLHLAALFLLPLLIIVGSWTLRNQVRLGSPVLVSTNGGYNLWLGNFPGTTATTGNRPLPGRDEERDAIEAMSSDEVAMDRAFYRRGVAHIANDPERFAGLSLSKALNLWRLYPAPMTMPLGWGRRLASVLSYGVLLPLGLWWLFSNLHRSPGARLAFLYFLSFTMLHAVFISKVRFRLPLDTLLVVLAVGAIASITKRLGWSILRDR